MRILRAFAWRNPVLMRELKGHVSSRRVLVVFVCYLLALAGVVIGIALTRSRTTAVGTGQVGITQLADIGQSMFEYILFFTVVLILFVVPSYMAPSIAGERERGTLAPLSLSPMRPRSIVFGKLAAATLFICLLVAMTSPLVMVAYLVGGLTGTNLVIGLLVVALTGVAVACITLGCSAIVSRAQAAVTVSYCVLLLLTGGTLLMFSLAAERQQPNEAGTVETSTWFLAANPLAPVADLVGERAQSATVQANPFGIPTSDRSSPLRTVRQLMALENAPNPGFGPFGPFGPGVRFDQFGRPIQDEEPVEESTALALWARSAIVLGTLSVVSIGVAVRSVSRNPKTF